MYRIVEYSDSSYSEYLSDFAAKCDSTIIPIISIVFYIYVVQHVLRVSHFYPTNNNFINYPGRLTLVIMEYTKIHFFSSISPNAYSRFFK